MARRSLKVNFCFLFCAATIGFITAQLLYAQSAKITVPADLTAETVIFNPQSSAPGACDASYEGQIYFHDADQLLYYCDGTEWRNFSTDLAAATRIVAASNSQGTDCSVPPCKNTRADFVCDGTNDAQEINQALIEAGTNCGSVYLLEGTYNLGVTITVGSGKSLIGTGRTTILKNLDSEGISLGNGALVSQLVVQGEGSSGGTSAGIALSRVNNAAVTNVVVKAVIGRGIWLNSSSSNLISGNTVDSSGNYGIYAYYSDNNIITENLVVNARTAKGIYNKMSHGNILSKNILYNNIWGGMGNTGDHNLIADNIFYSNVQDIQLHAAAKRNILTANMSYSPQGDAVQVFSGSDGNLIAGNNILFPGGNGMSINSDKSLIAGNTILDSGKTTEYDGISMNVDDIVGAGIFSNLISDSQGPSSGESDLVQLIMGNFYLGSNQLLAPSFSGTVRAIKDNSTSSTYTGVTKLGFQAGFSCPGNGCSGLSNGGTLTPAAATSYLRLNPTQHVMLGNPALASGKASGDMLILEVISDMYTVTVPDNSETRLGDANRVLGKNDLLMLLWNKVSDTEQYWVEIGFSDN